ncbi:MAG: 4Fe-4S double cluster binding domain-containing protein, partial [Anaerolineae bacterium]
LITRQYGPRVRLASVLTQAPLPAAQPVTVSSCGNCRRCVEACPANALQGVNWQAGAPREELVDVTGCAGTAHELLMARIGRDDTVCGICIAVCPFGRKASLRPQWAL